MCVYSQLAVNYFIANDFGFLELRCESLGPCEQPGNLEIHPHKFRITIIPGVRGSDRKADSDWISSWQRCIPIVFIG